VLNTSRITDTNPLEMDPLDEKIAALEKEIQRRNAEYEAATDEALKARLLGIIDKRSEAYNLLLREKARKATTDAGISS
jgi:hypothetical protein